MYIKNLHCNAVEEEASNRESGPDASEVMNYMRHVWIMNMYLKKSFIYLTTIIQMLNKNKINPNRHDHEEQQKFKNHIENLKYRN